MKTIKNTISHSKHKTYSVDKELVVCLVDISKTLDEKYIFCEP